MRLIKSSVEILHQAPGIEGVYKQVEKAARTCYKSEDKITDDSYKKFLKMLYDRGHWACFEQGTVYLKIPSRQEIIFNHPYGRYLRNPYSVVTDNSACTYVTTNLRVLLEYNWLDDLKYICEPTEYHEKRICVKFVCSRAIANELVRHRTFSFMQSSTRYCNYSSDKFGNEICYILPNGFSAPERHIELGNWDLIEEAYGKEEVEAQKNAPITKILESYIDSEKTYMHLIKSGVQPQIARDVLPLGLATELVMTGTINQWINFFKLRCAKDAHPDAQKIANELLEKLTGLKYLDE